MEQKYPHLFSPLQVKGKLLKNRIITGPSNHCLQGSENYPTEQSMVYFAAKAQGGAAMVYPGSVRVDPGLYDPRATPQKIWNQFNPYDRYAWRYFKQNTDIVHHFGALAGIEFHQMPFGGYSAEDMSWRTIFAVSRQEGPDGIVAEEMPEYEIERLAEAYAECTAIMKHVGYDCVIVHGGHGMQMAQFLSPRYNKRTDKYGGSLENRARYPLLVLQKIREKVGDGILIDFRISADEGPHEIPGFDVKQCTDFLVMAEPYIDFAHISAGDGQNPRSAEVLSRSYMAEGQPYAKYATEVKKSGRLKIPVLSVGCYDDPEPAERMLAEGNCDGIVIARGLIADPEYPNKAKRGCAEDIRPCVRCNNCLDDHRNNHFFSCTVNPEIGRQHHFPYIINPNPAKKKVVVVGGGPAGMQAALTAAERGHDVTLLEKTGRLGGLLNLFDDVVFKSRMVVYRKYMIRQLEKQGVKIVLNCEATPESIKDMGADAVVAALGGEPVIPDIPGADGENVMLATAVYGNLDKVGNRVIVVGGGDVGCETALYLAQSGRQVTILEMKPDIGTELFKSVRPVIMHCLKEAGAASITNAKVTVILPDGAQYSKAGGESEKLQADSIVLAAGMKPRLDEVEALYPSAFDLRPVGDCISARNMKFAVRAGFDAGIQL